MLGQATGNSDSYDSPWFGLGEATTFPLILYSMPLHEGHIEMVFCPRTPKWESRNSQLGIPATLRAHNSLCRPLIEMRSEAKLYSSLRAFQWYVACHLHARKMGRFPIFSGRESNYQLDSRPFFHNLCFRCPNGSCEPILDIYVPRAFQ